MKNFLEWLSESFDDNNKIGWWEDQKHLTVYHGTHDNNVENILKNGINKPDPTTGMISVTLDPHTAHGYAAMSGEHNFRRAGGKAITVPHENRSVIKAKIPISWIKKHVDPNLRGNIGIAKNKLTDKELYKSHKGSDHEYYQMTELRLGKPIPPKYIKGVIKKHGN